VVAFITSCIANIWISVRIAKTITSITFRLNSLRSTLVLIPLYLCGVERHVHTHLQTDVSGKHRTSGAPLNIASRFILPHRHPFLSSLRTVIHHHHHHHPRRRRRRRRRISFFLILILRHCIILSFIRSNCNPSSSGFYLISLYSNPLSSAFSLISTSSTLASSYILLNCNSSSPMSYLIFPHSNPSSSSSSSSSSSASSFHPS